MNRTQQTLGVFGLLLIGVWGCSQSGGLSAERAKQLESRIAKLEGDLKSTTSNRDALRARLAALEEQVRAESERAKLIEIERDALTAQLKQRTVEKDAVVNQYDDLVKKLEAVVGHAKVAQSECHGPKVKATVTSFPKK